MQKVRKRGHLMKKGDKEYTLTAFDTYKEEKLEELKNKKYHDLEDLVYGMQVTYDEIIDKLDIKYFPSKRRGYTLPPSTYEISDFTKSLQTFLPKIVKVIVTIHDIRLKSNLKIN